MSVKLRAVWRWLVSLGLLGAPVTGCGPDHRPEEPCDGPSFWLTVRAESGPLPPDTRLNVRYGGNPDGEPYRLGHPRTPQAVACSEVTGAGGAPAAGEGGGAATAIGGSAEVWALYCGLYTQGPARVDVTAQGYEPIEDEALSFPSRRHCEAEVSVTLLPMKPEDP